MGHIKERVISNFEFKVQNTTAQNPTAMNYFNIKLMEISLNMEDLRLVEMSIAVVVFCTFNLNLEIRHP